MLSADEPYVGERKINSILIHEFYLATSQSFSIPSLCISMFLLLINYCLTKMAYNETYATRLRVNATVEGSIPSRVE